MTSYLFPNARFSRERLEDILNELGGDKSRLVIDLSCRRQGEKWVVAMNKWQTLTDMEVNAGEMYYSLFCSSKTNEHVIEFIRGLEPFCSEFLVHAADNEGLQRGIDEDLVERLGVWCVIPVTYAGGGKSLEDLEKVKQLSNGRVDLTIGSALDIFGGKAVRLRDCISWNQKQAR